MKKSKKIVISVIGIIMAVTIVALGFIGNYFFNYALVRAEGIGTAADADPKAPSYEELEVEKLNKEKSKEAVSQWLKEVKIEETTLQSEDGLTLWGQMYLQNEATDKWVIIAHGYTSSSENVQAIALNFFNEGYNVLTPDLRAHGKSEGKYIGMGWLDRLDLVKWINYVVERDEDSQIVLYGESMGGATVMMTSGEELPSNVKAIVEDCGYTSAYDMFTAELNNRFGLPPFPVMDAARLVTKLRAKYDIKEEASSIEQVKKSKTPMLFTHGSEDNYVPTEMVYKLYEAATVEKDILIIEGAGHGAAPDVDPETYYNKVFEFLDRFVK